MNFLRSWALVVGLVVGGLAGTNCGPPKPLCSSTTCTGCCDSVSGMCVSLTTSQACGRNGDTCKACSLAESCSFGTCMLNTSGSGGGFSSAGGFATSGGTSGGFATGGGAAGGSSTGGGTAGGFSTGGGTGTCSAANCANGCCQAGQCRTFPNNVTTAACGSNGQTCATCQTGQTCSSSTFTCIGGPPVGGGSATGGGSPGGGPAGSYSQQTITASCEDLSVGATALITASTSPFLDDDVTTQPFIVPSFGTFFGSTITHASVQTNGMVQLYTSAGGVPSPAYSNTTIPSSTSPNGFAAPLWDDLFAYSTADAGYGPNAGVRLKTVASPAHYTVSWRDPIEPGTELQAKFFQTGVIEFHYCNLGASSLSASVGLEASTGTVGVAWTGTPATGSGVRFTPVP